MKKAKKVLSLVLAVVMTGMVSACGSSTSSGKSSSPADGASSKAKQLTIAFANTNMSNEFQVSMRAAAEVTAKAKDVKLIEADGQGDGAKQVSQIEGFIAQKVDAIVLAPTDKDACAPAVNEAIEAKIPIIIVNSMTSNVDKATSYVGSDDSIAGTMEMQYIADQLKGKGNIVIIQGPTGNSATTNRTIGINATLKKYPDIKVLASQPANWDRALGMSTMENWIQSGLKIDAVVSENDEMALGALKAVSAAGKQNSIKIVGIDATADAIKAVDAGTMAATVFQDAKQQGSKAVEVAIMAAQGQKVESKYMIDFKLVTKDNVAQYK